MHVMTKLRRTGLLILICLTTALAIACGGPESGQATVTPRSQPAAASPAATSTATPRPSPTLAPTQTVARPAPSPTAIPAPPPAIGDTIQTDGWNLTVNSYDLYARIGNHRAQGIYLYVRMTIDNTATSPRAFPFDGLVVTDVNGNSYFLDAGATQESMQYDFNFPVGQQLAPGQQQQIAAAFDIPQSATGLRLTTPSRVFEIRLEYQQPSK